MRINRMPIVPTAKWRTTTRTISPINRRGRSVMHGQIKREPTEGEKYSGVFINRNFATHQSVSLQNLP